jgi:hypothetical protein
LNVQQYQRLIARIDACFRETYGIPLLGVGAGYLWWRRSDGETIARLSPTEIHSPVGTPPDLHAGQEELAAENGLEHVVGHGEEPDERP